MPFFSSVVLFCLLFFSGLISVASKENGPAAVSPVPKNSPVATSGACLLPYIETVAGGGTSVGEGVPATAALLNQPAGVVFDGEADLYILEVGAKRVRKVDKATGLIATVGPKAPALSSASALEGPYGLTAQWNGNLYVAQTSYHHIQRIDLATGVVGTVAGAGRYPDSADFLGDGGPATAAKFNTPKGLAVDGDGNLYIADSENHRVRKVDAATGIITSVAGTGQGGFDPGGFSGDYGPAAEAELNSPSGLAFDDQGNLYIADTANHRIRKIDKESGIISTVVGTGQAGFQGDGGPAAGALLNKPQSLAFDTHGDLYVADTDNHRIRKIGCSVSPSSLPRPRTLPRRTFWRGQP